MPKWKNLDSQLNLDESADTFQFNGWGKGGSKKNVQTAPEPEPTPEPTPEPAPEPTPEIVPDPVIGTGSLEATEAEILRLVNDYRTQKLGKDAVLVSDSRLNEVAEDWSTQLAKENALYFNPELTADMAAEGYDFEYAQQIAGAGFGGSAQRVVDAWIASGSHEQYLVDVNAEDIGIGHYYQSGTDWGHYYSIVFGAEADMLV